MSSRGEGKLLLLLLMVVVVVVVVLLLVGVIVDADGELLGALLEEAVLEPFDPGKWPLCAAEEALCGWVLGGSLALPGCCCCCMIDVSPSSPA
jgi:hypothetical protein